MKNIVFGLIALTLFSCQKDVSSEMSEKKNGSACISCIGTGTGNQYGINNNIYAQFVANADEKRQFADFLAPSAQQEFLHYGVPASITVAQAILESDGGTSYNAVEFKNLYGLKCKTDMQFLEIDCKANPEMIEEGEFAVYKSFWESVRSHSQFLAKRPNYKPCFECENYKCWAEKLETAGYGGDDAEYAEKIITVIEYYELAKYDGEKTEKRINQSPKTAQVLPKDNYTWIFNNSHGNDTHGKRKTFNPPLSNGQKTVYEYLLNREIVALLIKRCNDLGIEYKVLVPELEDISLRERVNRANAFEDKIGKTILITIDHNAAPFDNEGSASIADDYEDNGKYAATGMESHHVSGSEIVPFLIELEKNVNKMLPNWHERGVKKSNFYTLRNTKQPACILELGYFDNRKEAEFITEAKFQKTIVEAIIYTICQFTKGIEYEPDGNQS